MMTMPRAALLLVLACGAAGVVVSGQDADLIPSLAWQAVRNGPMGGTGVNRWDVPLAADGDGAYAAHAAAMWITRDGGEVWEHTPLARDPNTLGGFSLTRLFTPGGGQLWGVSSRGRLLVFRQGGTMWESAGLDHPVSGIVRVDGTWYATTGARGTRVFRSSDGREWRECSSGLASGAWGLVATPQGDLLSVGGQQMSRSTDRCQSWWPFPVDGVGQARFVFTDPDGGVLALGDGIWRLDIAAREWTGLKEDVQLRVTAAADDGRGRYWMGTEHGVYLLAKQDDEWDVWAMGLDGERITSLTVDPKGFLLVAVEGRGLFRAALP